MPTKVNVLLNIVWPAAKYRNTVGILSCLFVAF